MWKEKANIEPMNDGFIAEPGSVGLFLRIYDFGC
jgi:hypothetical protein